MFNLIFIVVSEDKIKEKVNEVQSLQGLEVVKMPVGDIYRHPIHHELYDEASEEDKSDLAANIEKVGQITTPIVNSKGFILMGHRIIEALKFKGEKIINVNVFNPENELEFIISSNNQRVKLIQEIARELQKLFEQYSAGQGKKSGHGDINAYIAEITGQSRTKVERLRTIQDYWPDLFKKIDAGELSVSKAATISKTYSMCRRSEKQLGIEPATIDYKKVDTYLAKLLEDAAKKKEDYEIVRAFKDKKIKTNKNSNEKGADLNDVFNLLVEGKSIALELTEDKPKPKKPKAKEVKCPFCHKPIQEGDEREAYLETHEKVFEFIEKYLQYIDFDDVLDKELDHQNRAVLTIKTKSDAKKNS